MSNMATQLMTVWLLTVFVMDMRIHKVRNWLVLIGIAMGVISLLIGSNPFPATPVSALSGMLIASVALLPFYVIRWMGAGDVKFAAVMGLWFGLSPYLLVIWLGGSLLAGMHGIAVLAWRRLQHSSYGGWLQAHLPTPLAANFAPPVIATGGGTEAGSPRVIQRSIPYAGYMAIAAIWVVLRTGPGLTN